MWNKNSKEIVMGAVLGTVIGSLSAVLIPNQKKIISTLKNQSNGWAKRALDAGHNVLDEVKFFKENKRETHGPAFVKGVLTGLLLGAGSALLLAPKTGKQLRNNLSKQYQDLSEKTQDAIEYFNNNEPPGRPGQTKSPKVKSRAKAHR
jgi:gas vesicle protein